jgi:hypothetical protein
MNPWMIAAGAGLGLLRNNQQEKQHAADRMVAGTTTRFSPWTGMKGSVGPAPDLLGNVMQGASAGAMLGQSMDSGTSETTGEDELTAKPGKALPARNIAPGRNVLPMGGAQAANPWAQPTFMNNGSMYS